MNSKYYLTNLFKSALDVSNGGNKVDGISSDDHSRFRFKKMLNCFINIRSSYSINHIEVLFIKNISEDVELQIFFY